MNGFELCAIIFNCRPLLKIFKVMNLKVPFLANKLNYFRNCFKKQFKYNFLILEEDQFENLNIAWNKYTVKAELKQQLKGKYDFYCELCKKFMQKKLQLVDVKIKFNIFNLNIKLISLYFV